MIRGESVSCQNRNDVDDYAIVPSLELQGSNKRQNDVDSHLLHRVMTDKRCATMQPWIYLV